MNTTTALPRHKLSVTNYHRMIDTGILTGEDRVELIDGDLIEMSPSGPEHADFVAYLGRLLRTQTALLVREEKPVTLPEHSEPEPDLALVKPRRYLEAHPHPGDVLMIIEVADASLEKDRSVKVPLYARFRIPEVRIADVQGGAVESFWEPVMSPESARYARSKRVTQGVFASETIPGIALSLYELWKGGWLLGPVKGFGS